MENIFNLYWGYFNYLFDDMDFFLSFSFSSVHFTLKVFIWTWSAQADSFNGAKWHGWVFDLPFIKKVLLALSQRAFYSRPKWRAE